MLTCLPPEPDEDALHLLLEGARAALDGALRFVLVQQGGGGAGFARTLHLEATELVTCIVDVPVGDLRAVDWILAETQAARGHTEVFYDVDGRRREPVWHLLPDGDESPARPLGPADVLLVTGGGKGIAAECALALARDTGVR